MTATTYLDRFSGLLRSVEGTDLAQRPLSIDAAMAATVQLIVDLKATARKAILVGNGGSAAIVSHMQNDLFKAVGVRAMVFTEQPLLTALANDHGYDTVFHKPMERWADAADLAIAVSSSGESDSIISAVAVAREKGCQVITLSGFKAGNRLRRMGDINFYVPDAAYGYVELTHAILLHCAADFCMAQTTAAG